MHYQVLGPQHLKVIRSVEVSLYFYLQFAVTWMLKERSSMKM